MFKISGNKKLLKSFLPIAVLVVSVIAMALTLVFYLNKIKFSVNSATKLYLVEISHQSAKTVQNRVDRDLQLLNSISALMSAEKALNVDKLLPILNMEVKKNSFQKMGIILPNGKAKTNDGKTVYVGNRKYFIDAINGKASISDTIYDRVSGNKINVYAVPIYKAHKVSGVLFATVDNDTFKNMLSVPTFGGAGYSYIAKADGDFIVQPKNAEHNTIGNILSDKNVGTVSNSEKLKSDFRLRKSGMVKYDCDDNESYLTYTPLKFNDWYIITVIPRGLVTKDYEKIVQITVYSSISATLLFLMLFLYVSLLQKKYNKDLEDIVFVDKVTGGNTWNYFKKAAKKFVLGDQTKYAFVLFDIDKFKYINDIFGWEHGNQTLKYLSDELKKMLKKNEIFARVSHDNFVVLVENTSDDELVKRIMLFAKKVARYKITPQTPYKLTLSSGIYKIHDNMTDFDMMYNKAAFAKNSIKHHPSNVYGFYDDTMRGKILRETDLERDMHKALINKDFAVYLQPKYSLSNSKIAGAEALVRWIHPEKGLIPPNDFIPLFEKNGFIAKLDLYIFETVCQKIKQWINEGKPLVTVSVNISRVNFHNSNLAQILYEIASQYEIPVGFIEIEITETAVFENIDVLIDIIKDLRLMGFPVSIDDFGSGYSSLNLLKDLEVDVLKLDREFFNFTTDIERSQAVVAHVVAMAKALNIRTVSEGVETIEHVEFLKRVGCDIAQGYYFAKPMPMADFENLISATVLVS